MPQRRIMQNTHASSGKGVCAILHHQKENRAALSCLVGSVWLINRSRESVHE